MNRHHGPPAVRVPQEMMAAANAQHVETHAAQ
jgi:hypothetical protein